MLSSGSLCIQIFQCLLLLEVCGLVVFQRRVEFEASFAQRKDRPSWQVDPCFAQPMALRFLLHVAGGAVLCMADPKLTAQTLGQMFGAFDPSTAAQSTEAVVQKAILRIGNLSAHYNVAYATYSTALEPEYQAAKVSGDKAKVDAFQEKLMEKQRALKKPLCSEFDHLEQVVKAGETSSATYKKLQKRVQAKMEADPGNLTVEQAFQPYMTKLEGVVAAMDAAVTTGKTMLASKSICSELPPTLLYTWIDWPAGSRRFPVPFTWVGAAIGAVLLVTMIYRVRRVSAAFVPLIDEESSLE